MELTGSERAAPACGLPVIADDACGGRKLVEAIHERRPAATP